jgi:serine/threonine protein kinase
MPEAMSKPVHPDVRPPDAPPERLGRYRLVRPISTGGMARVFEGRRESLAGVSPRVAVKVILPEHAKDPGFQKLFVNEARIGSQLQHQNLVQIQDFDREGDHFYLVMEFVDGITLRRAVGLCRRHGLLIPVPVIAEIGRQVCDGLHYAHTACGEDGHPLHLVHRDIKPSNLMLNAQGVVKLLDFGISRALFSTERQGSVKGTWGYMAPEQATGRQVGPPSDLFGLAAVLYELATLRPLFPEHEPKDLRAALAADEGAKRAIGLAGPAGVLAPVLVRALQRDPQARFTTAIAFQRALDALLTSPVTAREQLVHFWATLMELQGENPSGAYRSHASLQDAPSRGSGLRSSASVGTGSSASLAGAQPGPPSGVGVGLQVAVGQGPADLDLDLELDEPISEPRAQRMGRWPGLLASLLAVAVLLFAGSRVLEGRRARVGHAPASQPELSLGSLLGSLDEPAAQPDRPPPPPPAPQAVEPVSQGAPAVVETTRGQVHEPVAAVEGPREKAPALATGASAAPADQPAAEPVTAPEPEPEDSPVAARGFLTVSSLPRSQVIIDGQLVGWAPLLQHATTAAEHTITLVADDGRRYTFRVDVEADRELRKVWHFDQAEWVE